MIVHTQGDKIVVTIEIGHVRQIDTHVSGGRIIPRWFHDLIPCEEQGLGLGWMKKRDALKDAQRLWGYLHPGTK